MSNTDNFVQLLVLRQIVENKQVYMSKAEGGDLLALIASLRTGDYTVDDLLHANPWISTLKDFKFNFFFFFAALTTEIEAEVKTLEKTYKVVDYQVLIDGSVFYYLDTAGVSLRECSTINGPQRV